MFRIEIDDEVHLELVHPSHAKESFTLVDKNRELFRQWFLWADSTLSVEDSRDFLNGALLEYAKSESVNCMVFYNQKMVGNVSLFDIGKGYGTRGGEIGYWLGAEFHGKGIIHRAVKKMLEIGFTEYRLDKITIRCDVPNIASCSVAKKLNFVFEGKLREFSCVNGVVMDMDIYSILKREFA